jgi:hypothetical protein
MDDVARQKSWWGRNWMWVVPLGCLTPLVLVGGCVAALFFFVFSTLKSTEAYQQSLAAVLRDPQVQAALGEPITPKWTFQGKVNVTNDSGNADITYDVGGPKGDATVHVVADKKAGVWTINTNHVRIKSTNAEFDVPVTPNP